MKTIKFNNRMSRHYAPQANRRPRARTILEIPASVMTVTLAALALLSSSALAQAQTPFTYQGQLRNSGTNVNGARDLIFSLYDADQSGSLLGQVTLNGLNVANGLFTASLDFGPNAFNGQRRWLQISVSGTMLNPRQEITPAPLAMFALAANAAAGLTLPYTGSAQRDDCVFSINNTGNGDGLCGQTASGNAGAAGVYGLATAGSANGVFGETTSADGNAAGVFGKASAGNAAGVFGKTFANVPSAAGVYGVDNATNTVGTYGVYGRTFSTSLSAAGVYGLGTAQGVFGETTAADTTSAGVFGKASAGSARGVYGQTTSADSQAAGVYGKAYSGKAAGVWGTTSSDDPQAYGGYFSNTGAGGVSLRARGTASVDVLQIEGGSDLAERFEVKDAVQPGTVVAIDPENPGALRVATAAYSRLVAGVVSGANGVETGMVLANLPGAKNSRAIALSGRVWVLCDGAEAAIVPGDLLTTSAAPGHAMKSTDPTRAQGSVIGKAMSSLPLGRKGLVLTLVSLQ
jgi:hypothetical protein